MYLSHENWASSGISQLITRAQGEIELVSKPFARMETEMYVPVQKQGPPCRPEAGGSDWMDKVFFFFMHGPFGI